MAGSSYASPTDLANYGINAAALGGIPTITQQAALDTAAQLIDGYLASRFVLPLKSWQNDLRRACAIIAAYDLMMGRGFDPSPALAEILDTRYKSVQTWLNQIAREEVTPAGIVDSSANTGASGDPGGGGPFTMQMQVSGSVVPSGVSFGGASPTISEQQNGSLVIISQGSARGW